jgi:hypothetical protein
MRTTVQKVKRMMLVVVAFLMLALASNAAKAEESGYGARARSYNEDVNTALVLRDPGH